MKFLFFGLGPLASVYAAGFIEKGHQVSVVARGERLVNLRKQGIVLDYVLSGKKSTTKIRVLDEFPRDEMFDAIFVIMRKNNLNSVLPIVAQNKLTPTIVVMANSPTGYHDWERVIGQERLVVGHGAVGGVIKGPEVKCYTVPGIVQKTTFGTMIGDSTERTKVLVAAFKKAGFPATICKNMDAWHKTHYAWLNPMANAFIASNESSYDLSRRPDLIALMIDAIKEGFDTLYKLNIPIEPVSLKYWQWTPHWILKFALSFLFTTRTFEVVFDAVNGLKDEHRFLDLEFISIAEAAGIDTPAIKKLAFYNSVETQEVAS